MACFENFDWEGFRAVPVVAILRGLAPERVGHLVHAIRDGGLTTVEITMNSAEAGQQIRRAREAAGSDLNVGAGTVTSVARLNEALRAGASFIVTPAVQPEVIAACQRRGIPIIPGACTPTEVVRAWEQGASMVKVFPAETLGPRYIAHLKRLLPEIPLLPTGGVNLTTMAAYREAGADGFGVGSPLFDKCALEAEDWEAVARRCRAFRDAAGAPADEKGSQTRAQFGSDA
jgi:2-dehydro-3-deoxyphosphogluconate aldolase/(4S)-4-hydroxy-2-oxoglutarate aldolase